MLKLIGFPLFALGFVDLLLTIMGVDMYQRMVGVHLSGDLHHFLTWATFIGGSVMISLQDNAENQKPAREKLDFGDVAARE